MPPAPPSPTPIMSVLQGFQASGILNAAIQLGVFGTLARGPKSAAQVATAVKCPERSTAILLDALAAIGLLVKESRKYRLSADSAVFLAPGKASYVGDAARIFCDPILWDAFGRYSQAVRHGGTILSLHAESPGQKFWETFAENSDAFAGPSADYAASLLQRFLEDRFPARVLDIACGSGLYGLSLAERCPGLELTLLDSAPVLATAKRRAKEMGLSKRVKAIAGDMFRGHLGGPYDAVIASHVFHHFSPSACDALMARLGDVLAPGGRLLVQDFVASEDRVANPHAAMFAALMLAWTREGQTYSYSEYSRMFVKGGFLEPVLHAPPHLTTQFLVAEKKSARKARKK